MKKSYEAPVFELVAFEVSDALTTMSSPYYIGTNKDKDNEVNFLDQAYWK